MALLGIYRQFEIVIEEDNVKEISPGNFVRFPAKLSHYSFTKKETILEIN